jgi:tRNA(Ile)-lysidine synthase
MAKPAKNPVTAIGAAEFAKLVAAIMPKARLKKIAVAVSGGVDSMALCLLLQQLIDKKNCELVALTVDHGLRAESAKEAKQVAKWLEERKIEHHILKWEGAKPEANIQSAAREKRYELLVNYCRKNNLPFLFLGHHLDDQAETFLMRLARGSGVYGLAAMSPNNLVNGVYMLRPLLAASKERLVKTAEAFKQKWVEDPSNQNEDFDRVKLRKLMPQLAELGLSPERLAATASRMGRAREAIEYMIKLLERAAMQTQPDGSLSLEPGPLAKAPREIGLRLLSDCLRKVSGARYTPRLDSLENLFDAVRKPNFAARTLAGCIISSKKGKIVIEREKTRRRIGRPAS